MNLGDRIALGIINIKNLKVINELKKLLKSQDWDRAKLEEYQKNRLQKLLNYAAQYVPYWREVNLASKVKEGNAYSMLINIPILNKPIIREQGEKIWSEKESEYIVATTGGTTGNPLTIRRDYKCDAISKAALWRARYNWGVRPSDRAIYLKAFGGGTLKGKLKMRLANKRVGEAFPSSDEDVRIITRMMHDFKPVAMEGYATGLLESINRSQFKEDFKINVVVSTGEMLYPHQRKELEDRYSARVYTYYGSNEIGSIAFECEYHQLHICEEHVLVETLNEHDQPVINEPGRIVVTDLDNLAMPFIRYELGDVAVISDETCKCRRSTRLISELAGRSQDYLSGSNGTRLQATQLVAYLKDLTKVGQLQFIQTGEDQISIQYDGKSAGAGKEIEMIINHIHKRLGNQVGVITEAVDEIAKTSRGKQPLVLRKI